MELKSVSLAKVLSAVSSTTCEGTVSASPATGAMSPAQFLLLVQLLLAAPPSQMRVARTRRSSSTCNDGLKEGAVRGLVDGPLISLRNLARSAWKNMKHLE